jgi:hypothetical protein
VKNILLVGVPEEQRSSSAGAVANTPPFAEPQEGNGAQESRDALISNPFEQKYSHLRAVFKVSNRRATLLESPVLSPGNIVAFAGTAPVQEYVGKASNLEAVHDTLLPPSLPSQFHVTLNPGCGKIGLLPLKSPEAQKLDDGHTDVENG